MMFQICLSCGILRMWLSFQYSSSSFFHRFADLHLDGVPSYDFHVVVYIGNCDSKDAVYLSPLPSSDFVNHASDLCLFFYWFIILINICFGMLCLTYFFPYLFCGYQSVPCLTGECASHISLAAVRIPLHAVSIVIIAYVAVLGECCPALNLLLWAFVSGVNSLS